eukprot:CAMPEP_0198706274 /NCGR_PEP_ID=MMETSP1468-20131203/390881_1 /TAXON_ID=1461545 /ORGANISM="Mantoniella sp, Strain CCMP1436" /LENGTH=96 /DNA_ID=CAMNT_0044465209 /DNA_START=934 /DNA_END=1220 /DNA_ORIENTATION=+
MASTLAKSAYTFPDASTEASAFPSLSWAGPPAPLPAATEEPLPPPLVDWESLSWRLPSDATTASALPPGPGSARGPLAASIRRLMIAIALASARCG